MSNEPENTNTSATAAPTTNGKRKPAKKRKSTKSARAKKAARKKADSTTNKKAEVIAMMKHAKGATLSEIMAATKWQAHTVRGFVSTSAPGNKAFRDLFLAAKRCLYLVDRSTPFFTAVGRLWNGLLGRLNHRIHNERTCCLKNRAIRKLTIAGDIRL